MMNEIVFYPVEFIEKQHEFESVYTLKFSPKQPFSFLAGQYVHLGFPTEKKDKTKVRHMSVASAPNDELLEFTTDLGSKTWYKNALHSLKPGDMMRAYKIKGKFTVDPFSPHEVVFVSGGIGITPSRSVIRDLQFHKTSLKWSLLHIARNGFLYEKELSRLNQKQWRVRRHEIDSVWPQVIGKPAGTLYYLSGSDRFITGMQLKLADSGIPADQIVTENFK